MKNYLPLIVGMALVTYIPRWLPLNFISDKKLHPKIRRFLLYIPYTSLSILIIRGILTSSKDMFLATFVGLVVAGLVSWVKENLVLSVIMGILGSFLILNLI